MKKLYNLITSNNHFIIGLGVIIILYLFIDQFLGLTNWGVINKVLLFENSVTSRSLILKLIFPLISFEQNLGFPILAESQAGVFEPIKLFSNLIFNSLNHINLTFFIRILILYSSIYILLKDAYKLSNQTSLITSLFAIFSPILWNDAVHQFHLGSYYLLPLSIYCVEKILNSKKYLNFFVSGSLIVFLQLLAGHFQYQLICLVILVIYSLVTICFSSSSNFKDIFTKFFVFFLTLGFGFCLAAFQILPTFELMLEGDRSDYNLAFQGSMNISGIAVFYKTLSKIFNNMDGSLSTLGYITIFIYTTSQFISSVKYRKFTYNVVYFKYLLVFFIIYLLSLGELFSYNNLIYKIIPFLENFRAPARFMMVNSFCTLMLFAISFEELKKNNFKINNIFFIFFLILIIFFSVFLYFNQYIPDRTDVNLKYWRHTIMVFYPFLIITFAFLILKIEFFKEKILTIVILFVCLSIFENISIMNRFGQYSLFFEKKNIKSNILKAEKLCKKYNTNSLNIVGEFKETEFEHYYNFTNFSYKSLLSSENCKVFYHHNRADIVKRGLGYNQSSLTTYQMTHLSDYQYNFLKQNFNDFSNNEFRYVASILQYFTNSKVFYISENENILRDDLYKFDDFFIEKFIMNYSFNKKDNIFDKLRNSNLINNFIYKSNLLDKFFPSKMINEFRLKKIDDYYFLPIWQDDNYYIKKNKQYFNVNDFSFGKKISESHIDKKIYYIPISFIIGISISFFSVIILFISFCFCINRR